jgi:hypothetical protein
MNAKSRILFAAVLAVMLMISGCKKDYYDLDMVPEGDTLHRTLVVEPDEEALAALEALYGHAPKLISGDTTSGKPPAKYKFEGSFKMLTPNDIGGSGFLLYCDSAMGSNSAYSEQFRGSDDLADMLGRQEVAFNRLFDVIVLWFDTEFGDAPDFAALRKVIDENLRQDLWNLSLYLSTFGIIGTASNRSDENIDDRLFEQLVNRVVHFLIERGYFEAAQLPLLVFSIDDFDDEQLLELYARALMNKMGLPPGDALPPTLAALRDNLEEYGDSVELFLESGEALIDLVSAWEAESEDHQANSIAVSDYVDELASAAFASDFHYFAGDGEFLRVELHIPQAPFASNGEWLASGVVRWHERLASGDPEDTSLPNSLFALWSEPAVSYQEEHFGRVVLDNEDLGDYCEWRRELSKKRGREWDRFLKSLQPGEALIETLKEFKFKGEPESGAATSPSNEVRSSIAYKVIRDIIKVLEEEPEEERKSSPVY